MTGQSEPSVQQNANGQFEVHLMDGSKITCQSHEDAELVLDAVRRFYEGNTGRRLGRQHLAALDRAGLNAANSMLYRSVLHNLAPHITVPVDQLDKFTTVLDAHKIPYWVDEEAISFDGKPEVIVINFEPGGIPEVVQRLLNGIP